MTGVEVGCRDVSHEDRPVKVASFVPGGPPGNWIPGAPGRRTSQRQYEAPMREMRDGEMIRDRWELECRLCGLRVVARAETLAPVLDKLAAGGVSYIELAQLARVIS
jgi:hypothetical protein